MAIPTYDQFIDPLLRYLAKHPDGARTGEVYESLADVLGFSEEEREELLPSGVQAVYKSRIGWAHDRLKRAGLSSAPKRGFWRLTEQGAPLYSGHLFRWRPSIWSRSRLLSPAPPRVRNSANSC
jgi:restriction system protein